MTRKMIKTVVLACFAIAGSQGQQRLVINEIMYAPAGGGTEWIEIVNTGTDTVNLGGWILHDATTARPRICDSAVLLAPGAFVVVARDASVAVEFPVTMLLVVMPALPALNNSGDDVLLLAPDSSRVDAVSYRTSWGGGGGRSLERIAVLGPSNLAENWTTCTDAARATPCARNSASPAEHDLSIDAIHARGGELRAGETGRIGIRVRNAGCTAASAFSVALFEDSDEDGIPTLQEQIYSASSMLELPAADSTILDAFLPASGASMRYCIAVLDWPGDEKPGNDTCRGVLVFSSAAASLVVNEIMFEPLDGGAEWIELFNRTNCPVELAGYAIGGATESGTRTLIHLPKTAGFVQAGGYCVLASDSTVFRMCPLVIDTADGTHVLVLNRSTLDLGNDGEMLVLFDAAGHVIDSIYYSQAWHNPNVTDTRGRSLERLHPDFPSTQRWSWNTSAILCGGTPGRRNSLFTVRPPWNPNPESQLSVHPNPFSPDGDGFEDQCVIRYEVPAAVAQLRVRVFDTMGRCLRTLINNEHGGGEGEMVFDGLDDRGSRLAIGQYIILFDAVNMDRADAVVLKAVVVVAGRL